MALLFLVTVDFRLLFSVSCRNPSLTFQERRSGLASFLSKITSGTCYTYYSLAQWDETD